MGLHVYADGRKILAHQRGAALMKKVEAGDPRVIANPVPAIVTPELWWRAQETLKINGGRRGKRKRHYLLSGRIYCAECFTEIEQQPKKMVGKATEYKTKKKGVRLFAAYRCDGCKRSEKQRDCEQTAWDALIKSMKQSRRLERDYETRRQRRADRKGSEEVEAQMQLSRVTRLIQDKSRERENVLTMTQRGLLGFDEAEQRIKAIEAETQTLTQRKAELERFAEDAAERERQAQVRTRAARQLKDILPRMTDAEKEEVFRLTDATVKSYADGSIEVEGVWRFREDGKFCLTHDII